MSIIYKIPGSLSTRLMGNTLNPFRRLNIASNVVSKREPKGNEIPDRDYNLALKSCGAKVHDIDCVESSPKSSGWKSLSPFLNAWAKVFVPKGRNSKAVWMLVWVKEATALSNERAVPKKTLLYNCISKGGEEKEKILQQCEEILVQSYLEAKKFLARMSDDTEVQSGFEIVNEKNANMSVRGVFGIEVAVSDVDLLLDAIINDKKDEIYRLKRFFTGGFAHEMVHEIREEIFEEEDTGQEIASHAIELLSTCGDNPKTDESLLKRIKKSVYSSYDKDIVSGLKLLQSRFLVNENCRYAPESFEPDELNKAMKSIPKEKRERVLKAIAKEILHTTPLELLRLAAQ